MPLQHSLLAASLTTLHYASAAFSDSGPYPLSYASFSAAFAEPAIPNLVANFQSQFIQHKWNQNVSHITAGYWYNSATLGKVRADEAYQGAFSSSLFDYTNTTVDGILNKMWSVTGSAGNKSTCFVEHIADPGFPLVPTNLLEQAGASFGGVVDDQWLGYVQSWNFMYDTSVPVIAYLGNDNVLAGYDFWSAEGRTKVVTRFFDITVGEIDGEIFDDFPCE